MESYDNSTNSIDCIINDFILNNNIPNYGAVDSEVKAFIVDSLFPPAAKNAFLIAVNTYLGHNGSDRFELYDKYLEYHSYMRVVVGGPLFSVDQQMKKMELSYPNINAIGLMFSCLFDLKR
jgi:hypothetical protein